MLCSVCSCIGHVGDCTQRDLHYLPIWTSTRDTRQLRALDLSMNRVDLTSDSLTGLHWLVKLNLSHNSLEALTMSVFSHLTNLLDLSLSNNKLADLQPGVFQGQDSLQLLLWYLKQKVHFIELEWLYVDRFIC